MIKILLLTLLLTATGCLKVDPVNKFKAYAYDITSTTKIEVLNPSYFNTASEIISPPYVTVPLAKFITTDSNIYCLLYDIPFISQINLRNKEGTLKLYKLTNSHPECKHRYSGNKMEFIASVKVRSLKAFYPKAKVTVDKKKLEVGHLYLQITTPPPLTIPSPFMQLLPFSSSPSKKRWIEFPLYNLTKIKDLKRFSSHVKEGLIPSVTILPLRKNSVLAIVNLKKTVGTIEDSYADKTSTICHQLDKNCKEKISYQCDSCRYGWHEVVTLNCSEINDKHCGRNRCGEKHMPACTRGDSYHESKKKLSKLNKKRGYCKIGLHPFWDQSGVLICM